MSAGDKSSHEGPDLIRIAAALKECLNVASAAVDEQQLFHSICDILVNTGLFRLAWFGYADENAQRIGEPIACSGDEDGFLQDLKLALAEADYEDPANVSLRTGNACWIKDIRTHPALAPIRSAALKRGYHSVLSFPVSSNGQAYGAFTLYGSEPDGPGQVAANLLKERVGHARAVFHGNDAQRASGGHEAEIRQLVDVVPQHIGLLDAAGGLLYLNRAQLEYHGYPLEDMLSGAAIPKIFHPDDFGRIVNEYAIGLSKGLPFESEHRERRNDGQYRWFLSRWTPLLDEQGHIIRWCSTATDIEDRKQAEERLRKENLALREEIDQVFMFGEIVGSSPALKAVLESIRIVAPVDSTVLIQGETGTGKEMIARSIHKLGPRKDQAFVKVNCAAIPLGLLESELFGHERGAFTGAIAQKVGRFELADKGTLFLDEVGDLPLELQPKLLRVLQEQEFERLGSTRTQRVDVRVLAATNVNLAQMVAEKKFRSDLYYRLKVFPIDVPPLRDRREDIPLLVRYFSNKYARRMGKKIESIPKEAMDALSRYAWPGNIRELQNLMERAALLSTGPSLRVPLADILTDTGCGTVRGDNVLEQVEREQIVRALRESNWVVGGAHGAAARLGLKRTSLAYKMQKLGISRPPK